MAAHNAAGLTAALAAVQCGQTIALDAGVTYSGNFTLPAKGCDSAHWVTIKTTGTIPAEGTRITPCYANLGSLTGRPAYACASPSAQMAKLVGTGGAAVPIALAEGADHYRLIGLEITRPSDNTTQGTLILGGNQASKIIVDRCWVHGVATAETRRGVWMSGWTYAAIIDSYFTDFHCNQNGACSDSQAFAGGTGNYNQGPIKIVNNFVESAAEGSIWGGDVGTTVPVDLEFRRNHYWKPFQWMPGHAGYVAGTGGSGGHMVVKNHLELKNTLRTLIEGNLLENVWGGDSQEAYPITITPVNQASGCSVCSVNDTVIRYNKAAHMGGGLEFVPNLAGTTSGSSSRRYVAHDNLYDDLDNVAYTAGGVPLYFTNSWHDNNYGDVSVTHNTILPQRNTFAYPHTVFFDHDTVYGELHGTFNFSDNLIPNASMPGANVLGFTTACAYLSPSLTPLAIMNRCFAQGGNRYSFTHNAIVGSTAGSVPSCPVAAGACDTNPAHWPAGNFFPTDWAAAQFVNYNGGNGGDYTLQRGSPLHNAASDGKDVGADVAAVNAAIAGVN
jgi:hypothetical protein